MPFDPQPVVLEGRHVRLEPLQPSHAGAIFESARDPAIFRHLAIPPFTSAMEAGAWIEESLRAQSAGTDLPFATVRRSDNRVVGTTRYLDIRRPHRGLEIGWTWVMPEAQRTPINTEAKFLLLRHAFEACDALRVQLKTDALNDKSRNAILRLGATFEGILRKHMLRPHDGHQRDTAMYSVIAPEWPAAKARLEAMLAR